MYKARDIDLDRSVALKFISPFLSADEQSRKRLIVEAKTTSGLDHPNICTVYEIGETDEEAGKRLYIAMAHYEGETLDARIKTRPNPIRRGGRRHQSSRSRAVASPRHKDWECGAGGNSRTICQIKISRVKSCTSEKKSVGR